MLSVHYWMLNQILFIGPFLGNSFLVDIGYMLFAMNESENFNLNPLFKMNLLKQNSDYNWESFSRTFIVASVRNVKNVHLWMTHQTLCKVRQRERETEFFKRPNRMSHITNRTVWWGAEMCSFREKCRWTSLHAALRWGHECTN